MIKNRTDLIQCACHSLDHQMIIRTFKYGDSAPDDMDSTEIILMTRQLPFFQRLKIGIKYIFGLLNYNKDYMFTELIVNKQEAQKIIDHLQKEVIDNPFDYTCCK